MDIATAFFAGIAISNKASVLEQLWIAIIKKVYIYCRTKFINYGKTVSSRVEGQVAGPACGTYANRML